MNKQGMCRSVNEESGLCEECADETKRKLSDDGPLRRYHAHLRDPESLEGDWRWDVFEFGISFQA